MYSQIAKESYSAPERFNGVQFHFHHLSEHTIDSKYYDLEMHTVHYPWNKDDPAVKRTGFIAAAMGLMFSVNDYDSSVTDDQVKIIDNFFDSLKWDITKESPEVPIVPYG